MFVGSTSRYPDPLVSYYSVGVLGGWGIDPAQGSAGRPPYIFEFGAGKEGTPVDPSMTYSKERGYGFEPGGEAPMNSSVTGYKPFYFSVALPEGNYNVAIMFGALSERASTTVKAELRRLMLEKIETSSGKFDMQSFTVNVRTSQIAGGGEVKLKDREKTSKPGPGTKS